MAVSAKPTYARRRPEASALHQVVRENLRTLYEAAEHGFAAPLPAFVRDELESYVGCGVLARGFARARCEDCGRERAVAFSCKKRGVCPSCNARRMASTAAQLVDRVIPDVPVRQWVLSVPYELRRLLAAVPAALTRLDQVFTDEIFRWQRERARELGLLPRTLRSAGITHMQRFGGAINLNVHLHSVVCDGVFTRATAESALSGERDPERRATFHRLRGPTSEEVSELAMNVALRFLAWCRKRGLVRDDVSDEDQGDHEDATSPIDECQRVALQLGTLGTPAKRSHRAGDPAGRPASGGGTPHPDPPAEPDQRFRRTKGPHSGAYQRWDVHAGVMIPEGDHAGRERLLRYLARAPVSLERMSLMPDGRIAYELRHAWRPGRTHVLLEPMQLLARLAALVPPPRHPLIRFHGAFAPNSTWRKHVVPLEPPRLAGEKHTGEHASVPPRCAHAHEQEREHEQEPVQQELRCVPGTTSTSASDGPTMAPDLSSERTPPGRSKWYVDWATLLRRVYDLNALACPCGGKLRFVELVDNECDARSLLATHGAALGFSSDGEIDANGTLRAALCADAALGLDEEPDYDTVEPPPDYYALDPPPDSGDPA